MQAPELEGPASHDGSDSCGCIRKGVPASLTGVRTGRDMEPRSKAFRSADSVDICGRQYDELRKRELGIGSERSKTPSMCGNSMRDNRESQPSPRTEGDQGRCGKAQSRTPQINGD